jgi:uncharacterized protein (TIGR02444 family)
VNKLQDRSGNPFWDYSCLVYGREGVAQACLALQDAHGIDVNILLFCCWLGDQGYGPLSAKAMTALSAGAGPWHEDIVKGLRRVRQDLKGGYEPMPEPDVLTLRKDVLTAELDAERLEQDLLFGYAGSLPKPGKMPDAAIAVANIALYLDHLKVRPDEAGRQYLAHILDAAFETPGAGLTISQRLESEPT